MTPGPLSCRCINNSTWVRNPQYSLCPTVETQLFVSLVQVRQIVLW
jgi:hypothetical protein